MYGKINLRLVRFCRQVWDFQLLQFNGQASLIRVHLQWVGVVPKTRYSCQLTNNNKLIFSYNEWSLALRLRVISTLHHPETAVWEDKEKLRDKSCSTNKCRDDANVDRPLNCETNYTNYCTVILTVYNRQLINVHHVQAAQAHGL